MSTQKSTSSSKSESALPKDHEQKLDIAGDSPEDFADLSDQEEEVTPYVAKANLTEKYATSYCSFPYGADEADKLIENNDHAKKNGTGAGSSKGGFTCCGYCPKWILLENLLFLFLGIFCITP